MIAQIALGNVISLSCFFLKVRCFKVIFMLLAYVVHSTKLLYYYLLPNIFLKKSFLSKFKEKTMDCISFISFIVYGTGSG